METPTRFLQRLHTCMQQPSPLPFRKTIHATQIRVRIPLSPFAFLRNSFSHHEAVCSKNPNKPPPIIHGRSRSRPPVRRNVLNGSSSTMHVGVRRGSEPLIPQVTSSTRIPPPSKIPIAPPVIPISDLNQMPVSSIGGEDIPLENAFSVLEENEAIPSTFTLYGKVQVARPVIPKSIHASPSHSHQLRSMDNPVGGTHDKELSPVSAANLKANNKRKGKKVVSDQCDSLT